MTDGGLAGSFLKNDLWPLYLKATHQMKAKGLYILSHIFIWSSKKKDRKATATRLSSL